MKKFFSVILILTVLFVSAFSSIAASSQYEIEVNLSQDKLLPGSEVEIFGKVKENGNGYSNTPVTIVIEREEDKSKVFVKELMTDSNGDFRTVFKLNEDIAYGKYDIYISSVGIVKVVHFTVEKNKPTSELVLELDKTKYYSGDTVKISGTAYKEGAIVSYTPVIIKIFYDDQIKFVKELMTDSEGKFSVEYKTMPEQATGVYKVQAEALGITKSIQITIEEKPADKNEITLRVDKDKYYLGEKVKIDGIVYQNNAVKPDIPVVIKVLYSEQVKFEKELMTDSEGKFSVEYKTTSGQPTGVYKVQAEALGITVEKIFNIAKKPSTGGGGGGGGGSSSSGASKNKGKEVKETEQGKLTIEKDENGNILATFEMDSRKLMKQLEKDNQNKLIINATSGKDADRVVINMDSEIVAEIGKKGKVIEIDIDQVKVEIEPEALHLEENSKISFDVRKLKKEEANQYLKELNVRYLPVSNIFDFKLVQIKGEKETKLIFKKPLIITINYNKDKVKNYKKLGVYYLNEFTKTWEYVGGLPSQNGTITFKAGHFSKYTVMEYNKVFADVDIPWANEAVEVLTARHIIDGVDDEHYAPYANITRAQFAKLLVYALDLEKGENEVTFTDVKGNVWYKDSVEIAASLGIVKGYNGCFNPNGEITREQMATMIVRAMKYLNPDVDYSSQLSFMDKEEISNWAKEAVGIAYNNGIVNGVGENKFAPKDTANRAQAAVMIYRLLEVLNRM